MEENEEITIYNTIRPAPDGKGKLRKRNPKMWKRNIEKMKRWVRF